MINKLKNAIEKRLASDLAEKQDKEKKERESLKYFYDQIILKLGSQFEELIKEYNKELEVNFSKIKIYIKYGTGDYVSQEKKCNVNMHGNNPIVIFLGDKNQIKVNKLIFDFHNKSSFRIGSYYSIGYSQHGVILKENRIIEGKYHFNIESSICVGHAQQEKDNFSFDINDLDEEKIIKESLNKFNSFINSFIEKGDLNNLIY